MNFFVLKLSYFTVPLLNWINKLFEVVAITGWCEVGFAGPRPWTVEPFDCCSLVTVEPFDCYLFEGAYMGGFVCSFVVLTLV